MRTTLLALAVLTLALGGLSLATPAAATCVYHEVLRVDPIKGDTGTPLDLVVVSVGYAECHPPPMDDPQ